MECIKITELYKQFNKTPVLSDINLTLTTGTITALIGPNGAGKTTLLKIIAGLILPDSGTVTITGRTGFAYNSESGFYNQLTVLQNMLFWSALAGDTKNNAYKILSQLDLDNQADTKYQHCSSGIKQKLSLARALLNNPEILLVDELTKSTDFSTQDKIHGIIKELNKTQNITILFVSHNKDEIKKLTDKTIKIDNGIIKN
jgi:ABC-type multidrug transport system ATPase subunit